MLVRIRLSSPDLLKQPGESFQSLSSLSQIRLETLALMTSVLLTPSALLAFTMGLWIISSELKWTREFFLPRGLFSHWQIWICTAGVLLLLARLLNRFGTDEAKSTFKPFRT